MVVEAAVGALASQILNAITSEAGKDTYKKGKELLDLLQKRFMGNEKATEVLANYSRQPMRYDGDLRGLLIEAANSDSEFARVLQIAAGQLGSDQTSIEKVIIHNETVHGSKTETNISAGRDVIQGQARFGKDPE